MKKVFTGSLDNFRNNNVLGLKRGIVKDLNDPDGLNRIKVMLVDEGLESPLADVMATFAGENFGTVFIPQKGAEVVVGFLDGKINSPIILGSLYNRQNKPPLQIGEENEIMMIQFPAELKIEIDNKQDKQKITITTKKGHIISLDDGENEQLEIQEKSGKTGLKIDFKNGEIELKADSKISFTAGQDTLVLENQKGLNLSSSGGKLEVNVNEVKIKSNANLECEASAQFKATGSAGAEISSSGQTVVKGSVTNIN